MTDKNNIDHDNTVEEIQEEIKHGYMLLENLRKRRREIEIQIARRGEFPDLLVERDQITKDAQRITEQLIQLEASAKKLDSLTLDQEASTTTKAITAPTQTAGKDYEDTRTVQHATSFIPDWAVTRSKVQYVDANLALRLADESQALNIMTSFTTLFLGASISFAVSFIAADKDTHIMLLGTATAFSILLTVIFGLLSIRSWVRAEAAKKKLFEQTED